MNVKALSGPAADEAIIILWFHIDDHIIFDLSRTFNFLLQG